MADLPPLREQYEPAFIRNCHRWLYEGYARLDAPSLCDADEPVITQEIVAAMETVQLSHDAPDWMLRMQVSDDPPVNAPNRKGKGRRRVDIRVKRIGRGSADRMQFEAKRLCNSRSVTEYVGKDGLGLFLAGDYGRDDRHGGMLGYVQTDRIESWLNKLHKAFEKVAAVSDLTTVTLVAGIPHSRQSTHERPFVGRPITIYHTFLLFVASDL